MIKELTSEKDSDDAEAEFVEVDPSGRYGRYKEVLGKGAFKKVYRAFDKLEGIEVAWNQVKVADLLKNSVDMERLYSEVHLLKTLKHKNIIKFYNSWVDAKTENINFITEIFTSGTLRQYRKKHKHVDIRALKKWSRQILEGLSYLHSHDPPVIHRDLKCDNIFVNGNQGEVKIGDLGLAAILQKAHSAHSVIGTPEFMAPELYEEEYDQLIDIYAFGMCLLELVTFEYPYVECNNAAQIYKRVTSGIRPASLVKVKDPEVRAFIEKCIAKVSDRLPAKELLMDPFLRSDGSNECVGRSIQNNQHVADKTSDHLENGKKPEDSGIDSSRDFTVQGERKDLNTVFLKLRIADSTGQIRNIHFPFDIEVDTSLAVASEMVEELDLTDQDVSAISETIDTEIRSYIPEWAAEELSSSAGNDVTLSENCISEDQVDSSPVTNISSLPGSIVLERLPSGRKYWSISPKAGDGSSLVKPGPRLLSNQDIETPAVIGSIGNEVATSDSCISQSQIDSSPIRNSSSFRGSIVLERLPSGRKYWSLSPKAGDGNFLVKPGPQLSDLDMKTPADGCTKENFQSVSSQHLDVSNDGPLLKKQAACVLDANLHHKKDNLPDSSRFITSDRHLVNGSNAVLVNNKTLGEFDSYDADIVKKLGFILVEHQRELDELKKKHELIVSDLLKELPLESRNKYIRTLGLATETPNQYIDLPTPDSYSQKQLQKLSVAVEGGKQSSEAENLPYGPIFRDKSRTLKINTKFDISGMGIAVILSDNGVGF